MEHGQLWKVLDRNGMSTFQGMEWSLPKDGQPGEWHEVEGPLELCGNGLHLTESPDDWWCSGAMLFLAEYEGEIVGGDDDNKVAVRKARLVRAATDEEYKKFASASELDDDDDDDDWDDDDDDFDWGDDEDDDWDDDDEDEFDEDE